MTKKKAPDAEAEHDVKTILVEPAAKVGAWARLRNYFLTQHHSKKTSKTVTIIDIN